MDKQILEQKFAEILGINESESSFAFNKFKEKIVENLFVGDALKVKDLGVFQIKEQLNDESNKLSIRKKTLLFSPVQSLSSDDSLFLTLDIQQKFGDAIEFDEGIFQLGIGKAMIKLDENQDSENVDQRALEIENKIDELIRTSERIQNYDIWEDYLEGKESKSILDDEDIKDELDSYFDDDLDVKSKQLFENDFEELNEDEIFKEIMNDEKLENKDLDEITNDEKLNEKIKIDLEQETIEESLDKENSKIELDEFENISEITNKEIPTFTDETLEKFPNEEIKVEINEPEIPNEFENNFNEKIYDDIEEINKEIVSEKNVIDEIIQNTVAEEKTADENLISDIIDNQDKSETDMRTKIPKRRNKTLVNFLIGIFLLIAAVGIYFLFFANPTWLYDEHEVEVALAEKNEEILNSTEEEIPIDSVSLESTTLPNIPSDSTVNNNLDEKKELIVEAEKKVEEKNNSPITKVEQKSENKIDKAKTNISKNESQKLANIKSEIKDIDPNENEVTDNIFSNGTSFSVQVSSWKQKTIAEREANKLVSKGFSAYVVKVFIPKFNGYWHRVRIGPYSTLEEAKKNQSKL
ncbi:MAG: SPOR domain-containing protein [Ignavibacteriae bacterium]|nr:SPOR domain-containing protein [Ignavibacteriota bacterium]